MNQHSICQYFDSLESKMLIETQEGFKGIVVSITRNKEKLTITLDTGRTFIRVLTKNNRVLSNDKLIG